MPTTQPDGYLALPAPDKGSPVLVLHAWWGLNDTIKAFCTQLAESGFVAFAPDLYHGKVADKAEIDHFWAKLTANGGEEGPCGWLKDPFGVSWQVAPTVLHEMLNDPDPARTDRVTRAYLQMKNLTLTH